MILALPPYIVRALVLVMLAGACSSAEIGDTPAELQSPDGGLLAALDAADGPMTLRQAASNRIATGNSISCLIYDGDGEPLEHKDDAFFRVFDLGALGLDGGFAVESVTIGLEQATAGAGDQPARVAVHTLAGGFTMANLTELASADLTVPNQNNQFLTVPVAATVAGSARLVVEFSVPDSAGTRDLLWIGSNSDGQSGPSYWRSVACGQAEPGDLAALGSPDVHIVLSVSGRRL